MTASPPMPPPSDPKPEPPAGPAEGAHHAPPPRFSWRWLTTLVVIAAFAGGSYWGYDRFTASQTAKAAEAASKRGVRAQPVVTARARLGDLPIYLDCLGAVAAFNVATVRSRVDGELVKIHFEEGKKVNAGDLLAEIDPRPYEVQLAQAQGTMAKDLATLKNAQINLERDKPLLAAEVVAPQDFEAQQTLVRQSEGAVAAGRAQVENAKLNLAYCRIAAPFAGRIGLRKIDVGNYVRAADATGLLVLVQTQPIAVVFTVPQDSVAEVQRQHAAAPLRIEVHGRDLGTAIASGTVSAIDNQIDAASGTVRVKATVPNLDEALFPNEFVSVRLLLETRRGAVLLPAAAVRHGPDADFVYVVKADDTVELRPVKVGPVEGDVASIETGVADGESVVVQGLDKLQPGMKVETRGGAAAAKSAGKTAGKSGGARGKKAP